MARAPFPVEWDGVEYLIPANKIMPTLSMVEDITPLPMIVEWRFNPVMTQASKLSKAYWIMLREAGVPGVTWDDVYEILLDQSKSASIAAAIANLLDLMIPKGDDEKKAGIAPAPKKSTEASSRKRTSTGSKAKS